MGYDVLIVGGGLAGSSAAIQLAERGFRVLLLEKQRYPAHKLCGEFLSVEVQAMFERLGVCGAVWQAGAQPVDHTRLSSAGGAVFEQALPGTALGLSRYALDRLLAGRARAVGATVRDGVAVQSIAGTLGDGFAVEAAGETLEARLVLGAYGKRSTLDRKLDRSFLEAHSPFVAFKAHFAGLDLPGVIELHAFAGGYCGLSPVEAGRVNVCWIAHEAVLRAAGGTPEGMIAQVLGQNPMLARHFQSLRRVSDRFVAVSQLSFASKGAFAGDVCMIGDTAGMIAPLCGDGMAMALRSAELVAPLAAALLQGRMDAPAFRRRYEQGWRREFGLRMRLGQWVHRGYSRPGPAHLGLQLCRQVPMLGQWLMHKTRG